MALALCTITDTLWNKNAVSLGSPETFLIRSPISHKKDVPSSLIGPRVSIATGTNSRVALMAAYLVCLRSAARSAAVPGVTDVRARWEAANVSGQVTSHVRHLPTFQGTSVIPSGLLPSDLKRPIGSLDEGTPDRTPARYSISFNVLCLIVLPALLLQYKPWIPRASTKLPHGHRWGAQRFIPSLRPMATLIASSSSLSPQDETGIALIQSPLCGTWAAYY